MFAESVNKNENIACILLSEPQHLQLAADEYGIGAMSCGPPVWWRTTSGTCRQFRRGSLMSTRRGEHRIYTIGTIDEACGRIDRRFHYVENNDFMKLVKSWIKEILREKGL